MASINVLRLLGREIRFWVRAVLLFSFPLALIWFFAGDLGFKNPFRNVPDGTPHAGLGWAQFGFIIIVICFYSMRSTDRVSYGFAELFLAFAGFSWFYEKLGSTYTEETFLVTTGGFIYLAVRGIDNIVTGAKKHYADPSSDSRWPF